MTNTDLVLSSSWFVVLEVEPSLARHALETPFDFGWNRVFFPKRFHVDLRFPWERWWRWRPVNHSLPDCDQGRLFMSADDGTISSR